MTDRLLLEGHGGDPETDVASLQDKGTGRSSLAYWAIAVLFLVMVIAAVFVPIGGAVIGSGVVAAASNVKRIAHPTGGVIADILVADGDAVKKGDVLIRLESDVLGASADLSGQTVNQLRAQRARLIAESQGLSSITFPEALAASQDADVRQAMDAERRLMQLRRQERMGLHSQLRQRIAQLSAQISSYRAQINALQQQRGLIAPELQGVEELWQDGLVTINRRNQLRRTVTDIDGQIASLQASIAQTGSRITETREQQITLEQTARSEAAGQLTDVNAALNDQQLRNVSADDTFQKSEIVTPSNGIVDKLAYTSIGEVIEPTQPIMEIVPTGDEMIIDVTISPADINEIGKGQEARILFPSLSQAIPEISGTVTFISAERARDDGTGRTFFRAHVRPDEDALRNAGVALKPGMPAEVFISTGSRSLLSYITKPFRDQFERAFRN